MWKIEQKSGRWVYSQDSQFMPGSRGLLYPGIHQQGFYRNGEIVQRNFAFFLLKFSHFFAIFSLFFAKICFAKFRIFFISFRSQETLFFNDNSYGGWDFEILQLTLPSFIKQALDIGTLHWVLLKYASNTYYSYIVLYSCELFLKSFSFKFGA